jgi:hypothetical protein
VSGGKHEEKEGCLDGNHPNHTPERRYHPRVVGDVRDHYRHRGGNADPRSQIKKRGGEGIENRQRVPEDGARYRYAVVLPAVLD